jgi:endonuclease/exonuclease/phosphatase (EEP) superfamily protein YafD
MRLIDAANAGWGAGLGVVVAAGGRRNGHRRVALLVLCGANMALMVAVAGSVTTLSDVLAPLTGHFMGIGLAASLAVLTRRLSLMIAGTLITFLVHAGLGLASCCQPPQAPLVRTSALGSAASPRLGPDLSLLALNTWHNHGEPARLVSYLAGVDIDLVVLSEFGPNKRALLGQLRDSHPYQVGCAEEWACSLVLLSRLPLESSGVGRLGGGNLAFVWARLGGVTVVGTQLYRPSRDPWLHEGQMADLIEFIARIPGPVILAGDLNTTPWSKTYRTLRRLAGLVPASRLRPTWPAWPVAFPQVALDHIFISSDLSVTAAGTGPAVGSDHLPIWAVVARRPSFDRGRALLRGFALRSAPPQLHFGTQLLADFSGEHAGARYLRR